jgi:hypothetical protein
VNAPLAPTHSPFGGSVAPRVLQCPASVGLIERVPAYLRKVSAYAERGTALHAAMALLIENARTLEGLVGEAIGGYTITADDVENALRPVFTYVDALLDAPGAEFYLEQRVAFPTIPGAFGTCDLLVHICSTVHVIDAKFGAGVRVLAIRPEGDEDIINAQLAFYAAAARHSLPDFFAGVDEIVLTILQPQSIEPEAEMTSSVAVTHAELDALVALYRAACEEALAPAPRLQRGAHCRFCPARPICPAHTGPLLDLAQFVVPTPPRLADTFLTGPQVKEVYLQALACGSDLVDAIKDIRTALHDQAKRALENGDIVPGYALSAGRAERRWRDEDAAIGVLIRLGLARGDVLAETVRSPKQVELRAKARGLEVPTDLIISRRSGVSLVRSENARVPVPGRNELVQSFSAALKAFQKGSNDD